MGVREVKAFNEIIDQLRNDLEYVSSLEDARRMVNMVREYQYRMTAIDFHETHKLKFLKKVKKL